MAKKKRVLKKRQVAAKLTPADLMLLADLQEMEGDMTEAEVIRRALRYYHQRLDDSRNKRRNLQATA